MPAIAPVHAPSGDFITRPVWTPRPNGPVPHTQWGHVIRIPAEALPAAINPEPVDAVFIEPWIDGYASTFIAVAPIHNAPFLSLRWDVETAQAVDVACWATRSEANTATRALADTYNSHHAGENRTSATIAFITHIGIRRVIGPTWGGSLIRDGDRVRVYADHEAEPIGTASRWASGARMLAKHHGVPARRLLLEDEN